MKILKQEVKTFYDIALDPVDFFLIVDKCLKDREAEHIRSYRHPNAFKWCEGSQREDELSEDFAERVMKEMHGNADKDTLDYIAHDLGFDGWHNSGYYVQGKHKYVMIVYNEGDTLNA